MHARHAPEGSHKVLRVDHSNTGILPEGRHRHGAYILIAASLLLIGSQFWRGLFFMEDQLSALLVTIAITGWFLVWRKGDVGIKLNGLDWAVLGLTVVYLASPLWGVNTRLALQGALKAFSYLTLYWVVSRTVDLMGARMWATKVLAAVAGISAAGAVVVSGPWFSYKEAILSGRLSGGFQYPNTLGGLALTGLFTGLGAVVTAQSRLARAFWTAVSFASLYAIVFSYSRGAWLVLVVAGPLMLALMPKGQRVTLVTAVLPLAIGVGAVALPSHTALQGTLTGTTANLFPWFAVGAATAVVADLVLQRMKGAFLAVIGAIAGLGVLGAIAYILPNLTARFQQLLQDENASSATRAYTYLDSLSAVADHNWILGLGPGGWWTVNFEYRSWAYISRTVHSSVLETLAEVGVLGGTLFASAWLMFGWLYWRYGRKSEAPVIWAGLFVGTAALFAHSWIDFDLSFMTISLLVYMAFGIMRSVVPANAEPDARPPLWARAVAFALVLGVGLASTSLWSAANAHAQADRHIKSGQGSPALTLLEQAIKRDPLNADIRRIYGEMLFEYGLQTKRPESKAQGYEQLEQAKRLDPRNPNVFSVFGRVYLKDGRYAEGIEAYRKAIELDRYGHEHYESLMRGSFAVIDITLGAKNRDQALKELGAVSAVLKQWDDAYKSQPTGIPRHLSMPATTPMRDLFQAQYDVYTGQFDKAVPVLQRLTASKDQAIKVDAMLWLGIIDALSNKPSYQQRVAEAQKLRPGVDKLFPAVLQIVKIALNRP